MNGSSNKFFPAFSQFYFNTWFEINFFGSPANFEKIKIRDLEKVPMKYWKKRTWELQNLITLKIKWKNRLNFARFWSTFQSRHWTRLIKLFFSMGWNIAYHFFETRRWEKQRTNRLPPPRMVIFGNRTMNKMFVVYWCSQSSYFYCGDHFQFHHTRESKNLHKINVSAITGERKFSNEQN